MAVGTRLPLIIPDVPPELLIADEPSECSYLDGETWRLPLRLPLRDLTHAELEKRLVAGDRRQGRMLYRTACPTCRACEPIRLDVNAFQPSRAQRRVLRRGEREVTTEFGPVVVDDDRLVLFNQHKVQRGLHQREGLTSLQTMRAFLGDSCVDTFEMRYFFRNELIGIAIVDRAAHSLNAVYFYWKPESAPLSPGTFSVMKQIELCKQLGLDHLYLGLYIANCAAMSYKGKFLPHERLIDQTWRCFDREARPGVEAYVEATALPD